MRYQVLKEICSWSEVRAILVGSFRELEDAKRCKRCLARLDPDGMVPFVIYDKLEDCVVDFDEAKEPETHVWQKEGF